MFQANAFQPDAFQAGITDAPAPAVRRPIAIPPWWNRCYAANRLNGSLWGKPCLNASR